MKAIGICGYFGYEDNTPISGGQMPKTRGTRTIIESECPDSEVMVIDTSNWKHVLPRLFGKCIQIARYCKCILILPNRNGLRLILPVFVFFRRIKGFTLIYPVVGGWLAEYLDEHPFLKRCMKQVDHVFVEANGLKAKLEARDIENVGIMPIFSMRQPIADSDIQESFQKPYEFCTFSRVNEGKGISDAIDAVRDVNHLYKEPVCYLNIYGPVDDDYRATLDEKLRNCEGYASYRGILGSENTIQTLAKCYCMLFPTHYMGEGFPTTICEGMMAGLPVIASKWFYCTEMVADGKTGLLYDLNDKEGLIEKICYAIENPETLCQMRHNALAQSYKYLPHRAAKDLLSVIRFHFL